MLKSIKAEGDYLAVCNVFARDTGAEIVLVWATTQRTNVVVSSHLNGPQEWTKYGVSNIYKDEAGELHYETESTPFEYVRSDPPTGYYKVTNVYYDVTAGEIVVE